MGAPATDDSCKPLSDDPPKHGMIFQLTLLREVVFASVISPAMGAQVDIQHDSIALVMPLLECLTFAVDDLAGNMALGSDAAVTGRVLYSSTLQSSLLSDRPRVQP